MKKIIPFLLCMLVALCACEKDTPNPPASVDSMQFEGVIATIQTQLHQKQLVGI